MARRTASFLDYKHRVLFSLLRAAARLALRTGVPLDQLETLLRMAVFEEARVGRGMDMQEIAQKLGKSLRTAASLQAAFRSDFFAPERDVALRRDIASLVNEKRRTPAEIEAAFPLRSAAEVAAAIDDLVREGKLVRDGERLARNPSDHDFFHEQDVLARIDGLNRQGDVLAETVWRRLLAEGGPGGAAARTFVFRATPAARDALVADVLALVKQRAIAADDEAEGQSADRVGVTLAASPLSEEPR